MPLGIGLPEVRSSGLLTGRWYEKSVSVKRGVRIADSRRSMLKRVDARERKGLIVHIVGSGHSGSTLLDMLLGGHSKVSSLGEAYFLHFNVRNVREKDVCTCGEHVAECPFWMKVEEEAQAALGPVDGVALEELQLADERMAVLMNELGEFRERKPYEEDVFRSWVNQGVLVLGSSRLQQLLSIVSSEVRRHRRIGRDLVTLYELVRRAHETPIIVDSTKNPGTFKNVFLQADRKMRFLLILRDGRAVCYSRMRREGVRMEEAARIWRMEHLKRRVASLTIPKKRIFRVRYEELASSPESTIRDVCSFLGLKFEESMLHFREDRHNLGGNPMRFRDTERTIRLDEAWRKELSESDLLTFDKIAGSLNERLGYK